MINWISFSANALAIENPSNSELYQKLFNLEQETFQNPKKALVYLQSIKPKQISNKKISILYHLRLAQTYDNNFDKYNFRKEIALGKKLLSAKSAPYLVAQYQTYEALIEQKKSHYNHSTQLLLSTLKYAQKHQLTKIYIEALQILSYNQALTENFELALLELANALQKAKKLKNEYLMAKVHQSYGAIYVYIHDYEHAINHELLALKQYHELGYKAQYINLLLSIGISFRYQKKWGKAFDYLNQYRDAIKPYNSPYCIFLMNYGFATIYGQKYQYVKAYPYIKAALKIDMLKDYHAELLKILSLYYASNNQFTEAFTTLDKASHIIKTIPELSDTNWQIDLIFIKAKIYYLQKKYQLAYENLYQYLNHYQKDTEIKLTRHIKRIESSNINQTRELEIKLLKKEAELNNKQLSTQKEINQQQKRMNLYLIALIFTVILFVSWQYLTNIKLRKMSNHDGLTGLYNRRFIFEKLKLILSTLDIKKGRLTLMILDLDDFKNINDHFGHPVGDKFLKNIAAIGQSVLRPSDLFARIGGEEFMLVLPRTDLQEGKQVAERIRLAIEQSKLDIPNHEPVNFTASIGIATYSIDNMTSESIYAHADQALYQAKTSGKNTIRIWQK